MNKEEIENCLRYARLTDNNETVIMPTKDFLKIYNEALKANVLKKGLDDLEKFVRESNLKFEQRKPYWR